MKKNRLLPALIALCAFLAASSPLLAQPPSFHLTPLAVGSGPGSVVAADLNGDGHADLVCANFGFRFGYAGQGGGTGTTLSVWMNNGHGAFSSHSTLQVGLEPSGVAVADINADSKPDLISANFGDNTLSVLTNNGRGVFHLHATLPVGQGPISVTAADLTGTGKMDLIAVNFTDGTLTVLTNSGGGAFSVSATLTVGAGPISVVATDINGDGSLDLVCANYGPFGAGNTLTVFTNNGHGVFTSTSTITVGGGPEAVIATDVNGDHKMDLVTVNGTSGTLTVLTNNGLGIFTTSATLAASNPSSVVATDINGDGKMDLAVADSGNGFVGSVTILTNDGTGVFTVETVVPLPGDTSNYADSIAAGDFNGDGKMDLVTGNFGTASLTVLTQGAPIPNTQLPAEFGDGHFRDPQAIAISPTTFNIYVADLGGQLVEFDKFGNYLATFGTNGSGTIAGGVGCAVDSHGHVYVGDYVGHRCIEFSGTGQYLNTFDAPSSGVALGRVTGVAVDASDHVYVADDDHSRIVVYDQSGNVTSQFSTLMGTGGLAGTVGIAFDPAGDLWVADYYYHQFARYSVNGNLLASYGNFGQVASPGRFSEAYGLTVDSGNNVYVTDIFLNSVQEFTAGGQFEGFIGSEGSGTNQFVAPAGIALDHFHNVLVSDAGHGRIVVFSPPPAVTITTPANGAKFLTTQGFSVTASVQSIREVDVVNFYYDDGAFLGSAYSAPPYSIQVPAGSIAPGTHQLYAVVTDISGASSSSHPISITVNTPGIALIDFDSLNTSAGSVGGGVLSSYLAGFGVTPANVTTGTALEAVNEGSLTGSVGVVASSAPNFFTQEGLNQPVSFTLRLGQAVRSFGFTRAGLVAGAGGVSHPQWTATALDSAGVELSSVGEGLIVSATGVAPRSFQLTGDAIASVRFDSDSQRTASFSAVLLDDLILDANVVTPAVVVSLSSPAGAATNFTAPAAINLSANVSDSLGADFYVSFYAGSTLVGSVTNSPYNFVWSNVLAGRYVLRARVVDASGLAVYSSAVPITVGVGGNATVVNFDALNAGNAPVSGAVLNNYLAGFGVRVTAFSAGTVLAVENQGRVAGGSAVGASSPPNILTQTGSSGPVSFTVSFTPWLSGFGFTRPELLAGPFVSHPGWEAVAYDAAGGVLAQAGEGPISSYTNVSAQPFNLAGPAGGPGIATVQFSSMGSGLTTFNAMLADDFVLTTNAGLFAPAVALTAPVAGQGVAALSAVTVAAGVVDASGVSLVSFYANGGIIGTVTGSPFAVSWVNAGVGAYALTAVAVDNAGLSWTSAVVNVSVLPSAFQFGILTPPSSQTVPAGGSATFSVVTTGTNAVTYQWAHDGQSLVGATASTLTVLPPARDTDAGTYTVVATSGGVSLPGASAYLTVVDPPVITAQPQAQTVLAGSAVTLNVGVAGGGTLNWQWLLNGTSIAGATNNTYAIQAAQPFNSGNYQVVVGNAVASVPSLPAHLVVQAGSGVVETADNFADRIGINPLLGPVQGNNQNATAEPGEPMPDGKPGGKSIWYTWTASFTGVISLTTQGSDFDTLLAVYTGTNVAQLTPVAADDDSGGFFTSLVTFNVTQGVAYQIAVDGFKGASGDVILGMPAGTGYRVLSPTSGSSVPVIIQGPTNQLVQAGARVTLGVKASSATPLTYQWYFQGAPVSGATAASLVLNNFQMGAVGQYDVLVANAVGSVSSEPASLQIAVVNQPGGSASSQDKFGDAVDLATQGRSVAGIEPAAGGGDTRGFSIAQTFSTVGATKEPGEPDHCGQAGGASQWYVYTAPGAGTLHVSTAGSAFNTILAVYTGPGTDFAGLVEQGCGYTTNFQMNGQPDVLIPNVAAQTKFFLVVDGYHGASGVVQLHVGLGVAPALVNVPADRLVTPGGNATFTVSALGSTNFSYQWQLNGVNLAHANNSSYTVTNAQAAAAGSYTVVVSNVVAAVTSAPPALLTLQYAPAITNGPAGQTVLLGKKAGFAVAASGVNVKTNSFHYQWYDNGAALGRATNATLTFVPAQWTNQGSYQVIITNTYGSATSAVVTLTVQDLIPPTVTIHSPANNFQSRTNLLTVSGTAADQAGVDRVQVQVNNNPFQTAAGSNAWSLAVTLAPGPNVITAQSVDVAGNHSAAVHRAVNYLVSGPLIVQTNGQGKTTSATGAVNGALLQIGRSYTIAASALPGGAWLFADWSSGVGGPLTYLSSDATLTFQMASNLVLQANFVTNPFPALAGAYNGLFYPAAGITEAGSGFFNLALPPRGAGAFSAQIKLDGGTYGFTGTFTPLGDAHALIPRRGKTPLTLTLRLNLQPPDDHITGLVSNALWQSPLQGDRAVFDPLTNPAVNYAGQFTMVIPPAPTAPDGSPAGYGYAAITNTPGGQATVVGVLADGSAFSQSVPIARDGSIPFYASLYGTKTTPGQGSIMGWLTFTNVPPQTLFGPLNWIKPAIPRTLYPLGFTNQTQILGSPYLMPPLGAPPLNLATPTLTLTNGGLVPPLIYNLTFVGADLTNQDLLPTNHVALAINPTNGIITITFQSPGARTNTIGHAIILQTSAQALGSFPAPTQPGAIILH